jgi:hypothetical protein
VGLNTWVTAVLYRLRCGVRRRGRVYAGLAVVVAVMVAVVLTLMAGAVRTLSAPDRYSDSRSGRFDASVEQSGGRPRTAEVAALAAVDQISSATFVSGHAERVRGDPIVRRRDRSVARRPVDLWVIPQEPADALGFDAEDQAVRLLSGTLVGVVDGPSELQESSPLTIFPASLLDVGDVGISATSSIVSLTPGSTVDDLRTQLDGLSNASEFGIDPGDWVPSDVRAAVSVQGQGLAILAAIAGIATVIVMGQLLSRQVRLSDDERLVLSSVGMTRSQVIVDQLLGAAVPTVAGGSAAVALAYIASGLFPTGFVLHVEPDPGRRFETLALLPGALAVPSLALAWVLVAVVVSDKARSSVGRATIVDAVAQRVPVRAAIALRFAFTRQARDATRPGAAVVGAAVVVGVLSGALTFGASLGGLLDRPARWGDNFDLGLGQGGGELSSDARTQLESDPDVVALTLAPFSRPWATKAST